MEILLGSISGFVVAVLIILAASLIQMSRTEPHCEVCEAMEPPVLHIEIVANLSDDGHILPNKISEQLSEDLLDVLEDYMLMKRVTSWVSSPHYKGLGEMELK